MLFDYFVGIDTGKTGSVVAIDRTGKPYILWGLKKVETTKDFDDLFSEIKNTLKNYKVFVMIEEISGFSGSGQGMDRMVNYGKQYGKIEYGLYLHFKNFTVRSIYPMTWKSYFNLIIKRKKGEVPVPYKLKKEINFKKAEHIFSNSSNFIITKQNADACLIAEYARLNYKEYLNK